MATWNEHPQDETVTRRLARLIASVAAGFVCASSVIAVLNWAFVR